MPHFSNHRYYGFILLFLGTFLFSAKGVFIKLAYVYHVPPVVLMTLRMLMAMPFYLWVLRQELKKAPSQTLNVQTIGLCIVFGLFGYYVASFLDLTGLQYLPANIERLILYAYPSFVILLSVVFLRQPLSLAKFNCIVIIYSGLLWVFASDIKALETSPEIILGALLVAGSALSFAVFFIGSELMMRKLPSRLFTSIAMLGASAAIVLHFSLTLPWQNLFNQALPVYGYALTIAFFCTVIPSFLLAAGIAKVGAASGSMAGGISPVFTLLLAYFLLGETLNIYQGIGFVVVVFGVIKLSRLKPA